jgi:preprotein translocase subunit SecF
MVVGAIFLGPGTLLDLALVLFIGILVGAYSSIFLATPLLVSLRGKDPAVVELDKRSARSQAKRDKESQVTSGTGTGTRTGATAVDPDSLVDDPERDGVLAASAPMARAEDSATITGRQVHKYAQAGPRNQPKRPPKSRRK